MRRFSSEGSLTSINNSFKDVSAPAILGSKPLKRLTRGCRRAERLPFAHGIFAV